MKGKVKGTKYTRYVNCVSVSMELIRQGSNTDLYTKSKEYLRKSCSKIFHILASNILHDTVKEVQRRKLLLLWNLKVVCH
jgi:hypothetical protein